MTAKKVKILLSFVPDTGFEPAYQRFRDARFTNQLIWQLKREEQCPPNNVTHRFLASFCPLRKLLLLGP